MPGLRPDQIRLEPQGTEMILPFMVNVLEAMGTDSVIRGQTAGQKAWIRISSELKLRPERGDEMRAGFALSSVSLSSAPLFDAQPGKRL
ncbi:TOBE domain-containing protein [Phaeovulum sp. W22_SRMD_FR3]